MVWGMQLAPENTYESRLRIRRVVGQLAGFLRLTELERARMVELEVTLRPAMPIVVIGSLISIVLCAVTISPSALIALAGIAPMATIVPRQLPRVTHPEYVVAPAAALLITTLAIAAASTGGTSSPLIFWFVVCSVALSVRFPRRGVAAGLLFQVLVLLAAEVLFDRASAASQVAQLVSLAAALTAFTAFTSVLLRAESRHRGVSVRDPLTGLLNRRSLEGRFDELDQQAARAHAPLSLAICDIDHFKHVNDTHGHQTGDHVLCAVATEVRQSLRTLDLAYRVGGEEFAILLPNADASAATIVAERLRAAVERLKPEGIDVTVSVGIAQTTPSETGFDTIFARADQALYNAKTTGRNRVTTAAPPQPTPNLTPPPPALDPPNTTTTT
jgi:diguanylate cyclase (GGDEF)-like protein